MSRGPDAGTALVRAIEANAQGAGCTAQMIKSDSMRWESATFAGARHQLTLATPESSALDRWLAALPAADLPVRGFLIADIMVKTICRADGIATIGLEALTVEA